MTKLHEQWMHSNDPGDKFCTQCKEFRASGAGTQIISPDRLHQRWICKRCKEHHPELLNNGSLAESEK